LTHHIHATLLTHGAALAPAVAPAHASTIKQQLRLLHTVAFADQPHLVPPHATSFSPEALSLASRPHDNQPLDGGNTEQFIHVIVNGVINELPQILLVHFSS